MTKDVVFVAAETDDWPSASRTATLEERPFALLEDRPGGLEGPETSQRNLDSLSKLPYLGLLRLPRAAISVSAIVC